MMTLQLSPSLPTAEPLAPQRDSADCSRRGPDAAGYPASRSPGMGGGGGRAALRQNNHMRRTFPVIQPLSKSRDGKTLIGGFMFGGSPHFAKEDMLELENNIPEDICGRHFLFDKKCARIERSRPVIPPLLRDYHRPGNLQPLRLAKDFSHSHAGQPFTLGFPERGDLNPSAAVLLPSSFLLNGRNTFSFETSKFSRPKVNYPTYTLTTVKDEPKTQSYPDPMSGAPRSFIQRTSELSSLEAETARQEKLKKLRRPRKPPS